LEVGGRNKERFRERRERGIARPELPMINCAPSIKLKCGLEFVRASDICEGSGTRLKPQPRQANR